MGNNLSKKYIRNKLLANHNLNDDIYCHEQFQKKHIEIRGLSSSDAERYILNTKHGLKGKLVKIAFENKETLKKIPFLGDRIIKTKNRMLKEAINNIENTLDLTPYFGYYKADFIAKMYEVMLGRHVDDEGMASCMAAMRNGASRGAIVYIIASSPEFNNRIQILNLEKYRSEFKRYVNKNKIRKVPIIDGQVSEVYDRIGELENTFKFANAQSLGVNIDIIKRLDSLYLENKKYYLLYDELYNNEIKLKIVIQDLLNDLHDKFDKQANNISALNEKIKFETENIANMYKKIDNEIEHRITLEEKINKEAGYIISLHEKLDKEAEYITSLHEKLDKLSVNFSSLEYINRKIPDRLITNGSLDLKSYLDKAMENVNENDISAFSEKDKYYYFMAELFRGSREAVKNSIQPYIKYIEEAYKNCCEKPFVDIGCGRGEFLEIMAEKNMKAIGVDYNSASVKTAIDLNYNVVIDSAQNYLSTLEDNSLSGVTMFQVVEHIPFEEMFDLCFLIYKKIDKNGCFVMETVNPYCFSRLGTIKVDPSHIQLPAPDAYKLLLELCGFTDIVLEFYAPLGNGEKTQNILCSYEGYCIIAKKQGGHK